MTPPTPTCGEKLRQVCSILVDNALRYSPEGGTVTVGATRREDRVEISIADEGIGIPQSDQEQIFRKFYRGADAELRAGSGGTGLGLFIARGLVTAMGGRIWVSSREGEGSRLAFELLAAVADIQCAGTWERLKACAADDCQWAFYDVSRNRSRTWCSMEECGNREKTRRYRQRQEGR